MSEIADFLINQGVDKEFLESLYRGEKFYNQQKIAQILNNRFICNDITRTHIKELFVKFEISVWSTSETRYAQSINPISVSFIEKRVKLLSDYGFTIQTLENMYKNGMSKAAIMREVNRAAGKNILNKSSMKNLWEHYNLFVRDKKSDNELRMQNVNKSKEENLNYKKYTPKLTAEKAIILYKKGNSIKTIANNFGTDSFTIKSLIPDYVINERKPKKDKAMLSKQEEKTYGVGITRKEAIEIYQTKNLSLSKMYNQYGISPSVLSKILKDEGIVVKTQRNVSDLLEQLSSLGVNRELIVQKYHIENYTQNEMIEWINSYLKENDPITNRTFEKIVKILDIRKDDNIRIFNQGKKSRKELLDNLEKLKQAGFDTREELAKYYEDNKNLTKQSLAKQLNKNINEEFFTIRWFERHLDPFLSEDRLKGVSRVEKEFQEMLSLVVPSDADIVLNDWKTIAPYQLDILIPELNIAIEFNGNYWHSDKFLMKNHNMTSEEYHTMKTLMCKEKGVNLLFVWEYDWYENSDLILQELEKVFQGKKPESILTKKIY